MPLDLTEDQLKSLPPEILAAFRARAKWQDEARENQIPPEGTWSTIVWLAGRFFGKTRTITEAAWWECFCTPGIIGHAIAPTIGDVKRVTFEGESGLIAKCPPEIVADYNRTDRMLIFKNGSKILGFGAVEEAERLRGPQCHFLTFDEAAAADRPAGNLEAAYKVASLGCRLPYPDGRPARRYIATTPRPIPFLRALLKRPNTIVVRGTSYENIKNVSVSVMDDLKALEGTQYGKQEIYGQILDSTEGAIFQRSWIKLWPAHKPLPDFSFIMLSLDTAMGEHNYDAKTQESDYSACTTLGVFNVAQCFSETDRKRYGIKSKYAALVIDFWMERLGFPELLDRTRLAYRSKYGPPGKERRPDVVLIEKKQSGISLRQTLMQYGVPTWPFDPKQGKTMRAHAVSPLVAQGLLWVPESGIDERRGLVRDWAEPLMDQLCAFAGEGSIQFDDGLDSAVQGMLYLSDKGFFHATPQKGLHPDPDELDEEKQRLAVAIHEREKRAGYSPYGS